MECSDQPVPPVRYDSASNLAAIAPTLASSQQHTAIGTASSSSSQTKPLAAFIDEESLLLPEEEQRFIEDELKKLAASPKGLYKRLIAAVCFLALATLAYTTSPYSQSSVAFSTVTAVSRTELEELTAKQGEIAPLVSIAAATGADAVTATAADTPSSSSATSSMSTKAAVDNNAIEQAFFTGIDSNGDDKISKEDFMTFITNTNEAKNLEGLRHMKFEQIDKDGDNYISSQDFHIFLKSTGDGEILHAVHDVAITAYTISRE